VFTDLLPFLYLYILFPILYLSKRRRKDHVVAHQFSSVPTPAGLSNDIDNDIRPDHTAAVARKRAGNLGVTDADFKVQMRMNFGVRATTNKT
jgi:hypothetical protein